MDGGCHLQQITLYASPNGIQHTGCICTSRSMHDLQLSISTRSKRDLGCNQYISFLDYAPLSCVSKTATSNYKRITFFQQMAVYRAQLSVVASEDCCPSRQKRYIQTSSLPVMNL